MQVRVLLQQLPRRRAGRAQGRAPTMVRRVVQARARSLSVMPRPKRAVADRCGERTFLPLDLPDPAPVELSPAWRRGDDDPALVRLLRHL
jgi:hypothetical protein